MKKLLSLSVMALLVLGVLPMIMAAGIGIGIEGDIAVEEFVPIVWQCDGRVLTDEGIQPWRYSDCIETCETIKSEEVCEIECEDLEERANNYLFEGEKYEVDVLVFDKNKIQDVMVDLVLEQYGDDITINCVPNDDKSVEGCNARIDEEEITSFDSDTMQGYTCTITVLDSEHMQGDMWMTVRACDSEEQGAECGEYDEIAPWFMNPVIELGLDGDLAFDDVRPGTASYSTISIENEAEGGVLLDMFIAGKNWPAADAELGRCADPLKSNELSNYLSLGAFRYYAEKGAYSTRNDKGEDKGDYGIVERDIDGEGYVNINYLLNDGFEEAMFDNAEIIQEGGDVAGGKGYRANVLNPNEVMALTFRLMLPEPCYGEFESATDGSIFIFAEAI